MRVDVRTRGKAGVRRGGRVEEGARRTLSGRRLGGASDPR
jgi:hypothetical protein